MYSLAAVAGMPQQKEIVTAQPQGPFNGDQ
jgi:hypothetical protein